MSAPVSLERVTKVYDGEVRAVDDVSLDVAAGEFVVLVGPSGCGKSTLLRMIAGLEKVTAGTVRIGERDVTTVAPPDRDIAMVFQNYALYPHKTVAENLAFGLRQRKTPKEEVARRVGEMAAMLGLEELMARRPAQLSGGQRQRVAMGRALVREPQVFLLDEPLSNLDAKLRTTMRAELARLHERLGITTVYVTHDQVEAMTLGQRVAVHARRRAAAVRRPAGALPPAGQPVRRGLHRLADDEPRERRGATGSGWRSRASRCRWASSPGRAATSCWGCGRGRSSWRARGRTRS